MNASTAWCVAGIVFGLVSTVLLALWVEPTLRSMVAVGGLGVGLGWYGYGLGLKDNR